MQWTVLFWISNQDFEWNPILEAMLSIRLRLLDPNKIICSSLAQKLKCFLKIIYNFIKERGRKKNKIFSYLNLWGTVENTVLCKLHQKLNDFPTNKVIVLRFYRPISKMSIFDTMEAVLANTKFHQIITAPSYVKKKDCLHTLGSQ